MDATQELWLLAVGAAAVARRAGVSAPLVLVVTGLLAAAIPGTPELRLDPQFVLFAFLPRCCSPRRGRVRRPTCATTPARSSTCRWGWCCAPRWSSAMSPI